MSLLNRLIITGWSSNEESLRRATKHAMKACCVLRPHSQALSNPPRVIVYELSTTPSRARHRGYFVLHKESKFKQARRSTFT